MTQSNPQPTRQFRGKLTRTSLLLLLPLALIPVAFLGLITLYNTNTFLREQISDQFVNAGNKQSELINDSIKVRERYLQTLSEDSTIRFSIDNLLDSVPDSEAFNTAKGGIFTNYERLNRTQTETYFNDFLVVSPDKKILVATYPLWEGKIIDQAIYDELLFKSTSVGFFKTFPFHTEKYNDRLLVFSSQKVYDTFGNHTGTIIGITSSTPFQRILELGTLSYLDARSYFITNPTLEGEFVGISETGELASLTPSSDHMETLMPKIMSNDKEGVLEFASFEDEPVLAVIQWLPSIKNALVLEVPQTTITKPLQDSAIIQIALLIVALVILGIVIWQGMQRIVRPITAVSTTAQHFADGDMQARATVDRNDEIGLLAYSFNYVADQLVALYRSMEATIESRTQQMQTAAEVAQIVTSASSLDEMLSHTVNLITDRFNYYHTAIYLLDRSGDFVVLREATGQAAQNYLRQGLRIAVGSRSIVGTVSASNQPWVADDVKQDPYYLELESLPDTQSEAAIPLSIGGRVLGVLDVQSNELKAFDESEVVTLQTLARQIASAIQNVRLLENTQIDLQSTNLLYQTSHRLADANTTDDIFRIFGDALQGIPYNSAIFTLEANRLQIFKVITNVGGNQQPDMSIFISQNEINTIVSRLSWQVTQAEDSSDTLVDRFSDFALEIGCQVFVLIPLMSGERVLGLTLLGSDDETKMSPTNLEPYTGISEMLNTALEKIEAVEGITASFAELQSLSAISQAISTETEMENLYSILHRQMNQTIGNIDFLIALYEAESELVEIPYMTEGEKIVSLPAFHLGQGLTSIVIQTQQPLMIVEDTVNRAKSLGALITSDNPPQSWLGVPMQIGGEIVGAIVIQDTEQERRFDEDDLRLITTLAGQVAPIVRNARLLAEAQAAAERDRQLYRITDNIRQATSMQEILETTTQELSQILDLRKAKIEIMVDSGTLKSKQKNPEEKSE